MNAAFELDGVTAVRGTQPILKDLRLNIPQQQVIALIGPNGAGKTTLLRLLAGLDMPASGTLSVLGENAAQLTRKRFAQKVCYIPQGHSGVFTYTVRDFVVMGRNPHQTALQVPSQKDWEYVDHALEVFGLTQFADRYYSQLSSGESRLVMLARGMVQDAPIILLDEPTANLDFYNEHKIMQITRKLCTKVHKTLIVSIHNPALALQYADLVYCIYGGGIAAVEEKSNPDFEHNITAMLNVMYAEKGCGAIRLQRIDDIPFVYLK